MTKPTIALIEDDETLNIVMAKELSKAGLKVFSASDGEAGLKLVQDKKPDLVLLDLMLPKKSGHEVLKELKENHDTRDIPVIILTALSMDESIQKSLKLGANDYFVKSQHTVIELVETIKNLFAGGNHPKAKQISY